VRSGRANAEYVREITRCPSTAPTAISALMIRGGLTDDVREAVVDAGGDGSRRAALPGGPLGRVWPRHGG
jgi:hypothetical protein